ncbi:MAG: hypothetical protein J3Q66DRAFT_392930, partial [Benniella sp.]
MTSSLQRVHELTLHVESPILDKTTASASLKTAASGCDSSYWTVTLTLLGLLLDVKVGWYRYDVNSYRHIPDGGAYAFMHIIPHKNQEISTTSASFQNSNGTQSVTGSIFASKVIFGTQYRFDIVLSASKDLAHRTIPKSLLFSVSSGREILLSLLKDVHSVDVCFVFTSDQSYPKVGLWAHRTILSRHKVFEELILKATKALETTKESTKVASPERGQDAGDPREPTGKEEEETSGEPSILTIPIDKFSLATMCSILYYIYSGQVQLSITPSQFAISKSESALVLYDSKGKTRESIRWDPFSADSAWKLKDVTWQELG